MQKCSTNFCLKSYFHLMLIMPGASLETLVIGEDGQWWGVRTQESYWSVTLQSALRSPLHCSSFEIFSFSPDYFSIQLRNIDQKSFRDVFYTSNYSQILSIVLAQIFNFQAPQDVLEVMFVTKELTDEFSESLWSPLIFGKSYCGFPKIHPFWPSDPSQKKKLWEAWQS